MANDFDLLQNVDNFVPPTDFQSNHVRQLTMNNHTETRVKTSGHNFVII